MRGPATARLPAEAGKADGLMVTHDVGMRRGGRRRVQMSKRRRSSAVRSGARRRDRVTMSNCCLTMRLWAITGLVPPGPRVRATVVRKEVGSNGTCVIRGRVGQGPVDGKVPDALLVEQNQ